MKIVTVPIIDIDNMQEQIEKANKKGKHVTELDTAIKCYDNLTDKDICCLVRVLSLYAFATRGKIGPDLYKQIISVLDVYNNHKTNDSNDMSYTLLITGKYNRPNNEELGSNFVNMNKLNALELIEILLMVGLEIDSLRKEGKLSKENIKDISNIVNDFML